MSRKGLSELPPNVVEVADGHFAVVSDAEHREHCRRVRANAAQLCSTPDDMAEEQIQQAAERELQEVGFWPRDHKHIKLAAARTACGQTSPPRGWYLHQHRCQGNPIVLDLLLLPRDTLAVEVELKAAKTRVSREQEDLFSTTPRTYLCRGLDAWRQWLAAYIDGENLERWRKQA